MYEKLQVITLICTILFKNEMYEELAKFISFFDVWTITWICKIHSAISNFLLSSCIIRAIENSDFDVFCELKDMSDICPKWAIRGYSDLFKRYMVDRISEGKKSKVFLIVSSAKLNDKLINKAIFENRKLRIGSDGVDAICLNCEINKDMTMEQRVSFNEAGAMQYIDDQFYFDVEKECNLFLVRMHKGFHVYPHFALVLASIKGEDEEMEKSIIRISTGSIEPTEIIDNLKYTRDRKYSSIINANNKIVYVDLERTKFEETVSNTRKSISMKYRDGEEIYFSIGSISVPLVSMLSCSVTQDMYEHRLKNISARPCNYNSSRNLRELGFELSSIGSLPTNIQPFLVGIHPELEQCFKIFRDFYLSAATATAAHVPT